MAEIHYTDVYTYDSSSRVYLGTQLSPGTLSDGDSASSYFEVTDQAMQSPDIVGPAYYFGIYVYAGYSYYTVLDTGAGVYRLYIEPGPLIPPPNYLYEFETLIQSPALACFAAGSLVSTPTGNRPVETMRIGDRVTTADGREVPVKWIGRQTVSARFGPAERLGLVRFSAGSLGEGLPHTDLTVTADHGMLVEGVICHAGALLNGVTITRVPLAEMGETCTVYHIETEEHEIILANGAASETFIDNVSRRVFDNFAEFEARYGDVPEMQELPYPRAMSARQVPGRISRKLSAAQAA